MTGQMLDLYDKAVGKFVNGDDWEVIDDRAPVDGTERDNWVISVEGRTDDHLVVILTNVDDEPGIAAYVESFRARNDTNAYARAHEIVDGTDIEIGGYHIGELADLDPESVRQFIAGGGDIYWSLHVDFRVDSVEEWERVTDAIDEMREAIDTLETDHPDAFSS